MIAEVIPYTRTIRGKDVFDYSIPSELTVQVGDVVSISFRKQPIWGVVWKLKSSSQAKKLQAIQAVLPVQALSAADCSFIAWFAEYYSISYPNTLKTMLYPLLKRQRTVVLPTAPHGKRKKISLPVQHVQRLTEGVNQVAKHQRSLVIYNHLSDRIAMIKGIISQSSAPVLIIVPEYHDAHGLLPALSTDAIVFTKEPSPSEWMALQQQLAEGKRCVIVGTKGLIFLPLQHVATVIVDQEEAKAHKQFHLNPRYHVRTVLLERQRFVEAQHTPFPQLVFMSHAPSLETYAAVQQKSIQLVDIRRSVRQRPITVINMNDERQRDNYTWFSEELVEQMQHSKKSFLLLNRTGEYSVALCQDCFTVLPVDATQCPSCNGTRIKKTRKGTKALEAELRVLFPNKRIVRVDREQDESQLTQRSLEAAEIVIGTEKLFRLADLQEFDLIGVLSIDHLLIYPHFQSHERVYQLLSTLTLFDLPLFIQTQSSEHIVIRAVVHNAYELFADAELVQRMQMGLPPYKPLFYILNRKNGTKKMVRGQLTEHDLSTPDSVIDRY